MCEVPAYKARSCSAVQQADRPPVSTTHTASRSTTTVVPIPIL